MEGFIFFLLAMLAAVVGLLMWSYKELEVQKQLNYDANMNVATLEADKATLEMQLLEYKENGTAISAAKAQLASWERAQAELERYRPLENVFKEGEKTRVEVAKVIGVSEMTRWDGIRHHITKAIKIANLVKELNDEQDYYQRTKL